MSSGLILNTPSPEERRRQIAAASAAVAREKIEAARLATAAATRDLRTKLRLVYRVPYNEWEQALACGPGQVTALLERYHAKHAAKLLVATPLIAMATTNNLDGATRPSGWATR